MMVSRVPPCRGPVSGDSCREMEAGKGRPWPVRTTPLPWWPRRSTYLKDLRVCAAAAAMAGMHPGGRGVSRAVRAEGTAALSHAPAALKARVGFEAEAAALPQGRTLVEVGCGWGETVSSAHPQPTPGGCPTWLTLDILRIIDDKVVVPHH